MNKNEYPEFVEKTAPKTRKLKTMVWAFIIGGLICCVGEAIKDIFAAGFRLEGKSLASYVTMTMIFLGSLFTAFGLYDKLGRKAGAGSIVPITGFANSITASAMEHNREGVIFGVCTQLFTIAGPVIVFGIALSVIAGLIKLIIIK
ncbi:MAG: stage V sporulation protein AC [Clostridiales bacterium]|jgi:stage V sporulation protein AC|nr:stage V sporulation protein AC [Clostridiales bacterium]